MFGKLFATIAKPQATKVMANNNFLAIIKDIDTAKENNNNSNNKYNDLINESINIIKEYCDTNNTDELVKAIDILVNAIELKKSKPDAYFYLSSIAYTTNDLDMSLKYLKYTSSINPTFPKLNLLRDCITNSINIRKV